MKEQLAKNYFPKISINQNTPQITVIRNKKRTYWSNTFKNNIN